MSLLRMRPNEDSHETLSLCVFCSRGLEAAQPRRAPHPN